MTYTSGLAQGSISLPVSDTAGSDTVATFNGTTQLATATENFSNGNRYLLLSAGDPFGQLIESYTYQGNTYPASTQEWVVVFNGQPDFISPLDFYILGPGKTTRTALPRLPFRGLRAEDR